MKQILALLTVLLPFIAHSQSDADYVPNQLIVKFKDDLNVDGTVAVETVHFGIETVDAITKQLQLSTVKRIGNGRAQNTFLLSFAEDVNIKEHIRLMEQTKHFDFVELNYKCTGGGVKGSAETIPNDTYFSRQYAFSNNGTFSLYPSTVDADIDMTEAWDIETGDPNIVLAVLDAGIRLGHPEFAGRMWLNQSETSNGLDDDSNGYTDDINGYDFANDDADPTDDHGHGTNVAGIAAATGNNNIGYAGTDWYCRVMPIKVLDENNSGNYSWWIDAIYYAVDNGANVINMSLGGSGYSSAAENAINYAYSNNVTIGLHDEL